MSLKFIYKELLKENTKVWEKVSSLIGKKFDSDFVYGDSKKYIKTKIKSYGDIINTHFQGKKVPKESVLYKCLTLILLDSVIRVNKMHYP